MTTTILQKFDTAAALSDNFNKSTGGNSSAGSFAWGSGVGIEGGAGITVPTGSDEIWTTKQAYTVAADGTYKLGVLYKNSDNNGYGSWASPPPTRTWPAAAAPPRRRRRWVSPFMAGVATGSTTACLRI